MAEQRKETGFVSDDDMKAEYEQQPITQTKDKYAEDLLEDMPLDMFSRIDADHDMHRIRSATALINTFNYAIQVQAKRTTWLPSDYHRFIRALLALDSIGSEAVATAQTERLESDVRDTIKQQVRPQGEQQERQAPLAEEARAQVPQPSRQAPLSSLPREPRENSIRHDDGVIRDDLRMPRVR